MDGWGKKSFPTRIFIGNSFLDAGGVGFRSVQFAVFQEKMCKKWAAITLKNYDGGNCSRLRRVAMAIYGRQKNQFMDFTFHFMDRVSFLTGFWGR